MKAQLIVFVTIIFFGHFACVNTVDKEYEEELRVTSRTYKAYSTHYKKVRLYASKYLQQGLPTARQYLNDSGMRFYHADHFDVILKRVQEQRVGINGMEVWKNGEYYDVRVFEPVWGNDEYDSTWYMAAYRELRIPESAYMYMCTFKLSPDRLVEFENDSSLQDTSQAVCKWPADVLL